ncbi:MAG TPA: hypothetical protein VK489_05830 [Ferruginibacter sp.]|nr:hypothetical protein [Ferruginibacter sp.]
MKKLLFKFTHHTGEEHDVQLEGIFTNEEGLRTFEKCSAESVAVERFQVWLNSTIGNKKTLSEFLLQHQGEK